MKGNMQEGINSNCRLGESGHLKNYHNISEKSNNL